MAYVYGHYKADTGELFYIGKGTGDRAWQTSKGRRRNTHWQRIVDKHGLEVRILEDGLTDEEAYAKERELIAEIGLNNLANITEGGYGSTPNNQEVLAKRMETYQTAEYRNRRSELTRKQWEDAEFRERTIAARNTPEYRNRMSARFKGRTFSEEHRRKISEAAKGRVSWNKGKTPSAETREKLRKAALLQHSKKSSSNPNVTTVDNER
jgi:hypothetical protein